MIELSRETEVLALRLAAAQSLSVENVIRQALEQLARSPGGASEPSGRRGLSPEVLAARRAKLDRIVADIAAMPILDPRSPSEIMDD